MTSYCHERNSQFPVVSLYQKPLPSVTKQHCAGGVTEHTYLVLTPSFFFCFFFYYSWLGQLKTSSCLCVWTAILMEQMTWKWSPIWSRSALSPKSSSTITCCVSGQPRLFEFSPAFDHTQGITLNLIVLYVLLFLDVMFQGAAQCAQRQLGYYGEAGDLQWAVQCQES